MKRTGTALSLLIGLSLLGSGLSYAENYKYEYVNKWSGDATEGDPITVHYLQGWNQDKVTVGTDGTSQVTIADYGGSNGGEAPSWGKTLPLPVDLPPEVSSMPGTQTQRTFRQ